MPARPEPAFTLIEVIVAIGLLAVSVMAVLALHGAISRSVAEISGYDRAAQLPDAITTELERLRDLPVADGQPRQLDALAALIPPSGSTRPLKLVATKDASRVIRESEAGNPATGIPSRERYFLVEVRQQPAPLGYVAEVGYLAVTLTVKWPYLTATGPGADDAIAADPAQVSVVIFNSVLLP